MATFSAIRPPLCGQLQSDRSCSPASTITGESSTRRWSQGALAAVSSKQRSQPHVQSIRPLLEPFYPFVMADLNEIDYDGLPKIRLSGWELASVLSHKGHVAQI